MVTVAQHFDEIIGFVFYIAASIDMASSNSLDSYFRCDMWRTKSYTFHDHSINGLVQDIITDLLTGTSQFDM